MDIRNNAIVEGQIDPRFNKKVRFLVQQQDSFYVYLDDNLDIQWVNDENSSSIDFANILNTMASLESKSRFIEEDETRHDIKRRIAEGLSRYLDTQNKQVTDKMYHDIDNDIKRLNIKISWKWYFNTAFNITYGCASAILIIWVLRNDIRHLIGALAFDILIGSLSGSLGALVSIISRGDKLNLDANFGKNIHYKECTSRMAMGVISASLVSLLIKSGILIHGITFSGSPLAALVSLSIIAGASERLIPNIISKAEASLKTTTE